MDNKENKEEKKDQFKSPELVPSEPKTKPKQESAADQAPDKKSAKPTPVGKKAPEKTPPGKFSLLMQKVLRTVVIALVLFGTGVVAGYFLLQRPAVTDLSGQVETLEGQITALEGEVSDLNKQVLDLTPFEEENKSLYTALADEELHVQLLSVLRDVQAAQIALIEGELDVARLILPRTEGKLDDLRSMLPADNQGVVDDMLQRLDLTLEGLDDDLVAAASDLSVLENKLTEIEAILFAVP